MNLESRIKLSDPNSYYGTPFRYWIAKYLPNLIKSYCPNNDARILDLGCGQGQYTELFKSLDIHGTYLGIDLNRRENWDKLDSISTLKIDLKEHDAEQLPTLNQTFNFICSVTTFEHFENQTAVIDGAYEATDMNGNIMIIIPSHYSYLLYGTHGYRRYSKNSLQKLVSNAGYISVKSGKIGGLFSFIFHFFWRNISFILKRGLKMIFYLCFFGKKEVARKKLPTLTIILDNLMHLHLKTSIGRMVHKSIIIFSHKLDSILPIFEVGYYCIAKKEGDDK